MELMKEFDWSLPYDRDQIIKLLANTSDDIIGFYCLSHATDTETEKIYDFLDKFIGMRKKISRFDVRSISEIQILYDTFLHEKCCKRYRKNVELEFERIINEEVSVTGYAICQFYHKNHVIEDIIKDPRFKGFKFEWTEGDKLKISL